MTFMIHFGITLFVRYIRLFRNKLKMSQRRLWIETIVMNGLSLIFCYFMFQKDRTSEFVVIPVIVWGVVAIVLAIYALVLSLQTD